jgi:hypothetical protein
LDFRFVLKQNAVEAGTAAKTKFLKRCPVFSEFQTCVFADWLNFVANGAFLNNDCLFAKK